MNEFWPGSLGEWLRVAGQVVAGAALATATVWRFIRGYVNRKIKAETEARQLKHEELDKKFTKNNEDVHRALGKLEVLDVRMLELNTARVSDKYEMKDFIKDQVHNLELNIERLRRGE